MSQAVSQGLLPGNSSGPQPPSLQQLPQAAAMYHPSAAYSAAFSAPVPLQPGMQPHLIAPVQVFFPGQPMAFMQAPVLVSNACPSILRPVSHLTFAHTEPVHCSQQRLLFQQYASAPSKPLPMPVSQPIASTPLPPAIPPEPEALTTPLPTCMLKPEAFSRSAAPKPVAKVVPAKFSRVCRPTANHAVVRKEDVSCVSKTLSSTLASPSIWAGKPSSHSAFHLTASAATCP